MQIMELLNGSFIVNKNGLQFNTQSIDNVQALYKI